jgi:hypothetical protein
LKGADLARIADDFDRSASLPDSTSSMHGDLELVMKAQWNFGSEMPVRE